MIRIGILHTMAEQQQGLGLHTRREALMEEMRRQTKEMFPNLQTEVYFIPNQIFQSVKYVAMENRSIPGHQVLKQVKTPLDIFSADRAEADVMGCLRHIIKLQGQPMVILSNYFFGDFLHEKVDDDDESARSASVATKKSKSRDIVCPNLKNLEQDLENVEFDNLLISQSRFVLIETKAFGFCDSAGGQDHDEDRGHQQAEPTSQLKERLEKAMQQLTKCEQVLLKVVSSFPGDLHEVPVVKCIALPFSQRASVQEVINNNPDLAQVLSELFKTSTMKDTLKHFLCEEEMVCMNTLKSRRGDDSSPARTDPLYEWWVNLTAGTSSPRSEMTLDDYEKIVSMFCGPYSKLDITRGNPPRKKSHRRAEKRPASEQVRTVADCVHLTGLRFGRSIVREDQIQILDSPASFVFLAGPPGSGKTLLLGLKAVEWAKADDNVVFVCPEGIGWGSLVSLTLGAQVARSLVAQPETSQQATSVKKKAMKEKPAQFTQSPPSTKSLEPEISEETSSKTMTAKFQTLTTDTGPESSEIIPNSPKNISRVMFSKTTDSLSFLQNLLAENKEKRLRLIIDECPIKVDHSRLYSQLAGVHRRLGVTKAKLQSMQEAEQGARANQESKATTAEKLTSEFEESDGAEESSGTPSTSLPLPIKEYVGKIRRHLVEIMDRLLVLQPANKRPPITQSDEWKLYIKNIETVCKEIQVQTETIETLLLASCFSAGEEKKFPVLEEAEAKTLDASGLLFNVETAMDFFVIDDILGSLATQHNDKDIKVWASGVYPSYQPDGFEQKLLRRCLRCPPRVQEVLNYVEKDISDGPGFTYQCSSTAEDRFVLPTCGPDVKLLHHGSHEAKEVNDCSDCGKILADYLRHCFSQSQGLRLEDVIISGSFDISGYDCKFTQTLAQEGVNLQNVDDVTGTRTPPPYPGKAFVIGGSPLQGLEAKIVVFLPDFARIPTNTADPKQFREGLPDWLKHLGRWNRCHLWFVASRCLSQLVVFTE